MKPFVTLCLNLVFAATLAVTAFARAGQQAEQQAAQPAGDAALAPVEPVITGKEVTAVQNALLGRGFLNQRPSGILDARTREALRAYQKESNLEATGRIDLPTLNALGLGYPVDAKAASTRRNGLLPKIGYGAKDSATTATKAVTDTSRAVGRGTKTGYDKTIQGTSTAYNKTKDVTVGTAQSVAGGAKTVGNKTMGATRRVGDTLVGRSDMDIHSDIRSVMDGDPNTRTWITSVKAGNVTLKVPPQNKADVGAVVTSVRRVSGVKTVFVVGQ